MNDSSLSIISGQGNTLKFDANSTKLKTKKLGINWDKSNDYSVPFKIPDGPKNFLSRDQVDAMRLQSLGTSITDKVSKNPGESKTSVSVTVGGKTYNISAAEIGAQLHGKGIVT